MSGGVRVLAGTALFLSGCLVYPVPERTPEVTTHRGAIAEEDVASLERECASRHEVLLRLGEPDFVADDGRRFTYVWEVIDAEVHYFLGGRDDAVRSNRRLILEFDESGHLLPIRESARR